MEDLQKQLVSYKETVEKLTLQVSKQLPPFSEESFVSDEQIQFYTGLPNIKIVKVVFEHVSRGLASDSGTKLSQFQEFLCVLVKLRTNAAIEDLCYHLNISPATVSLNWLKQMDTRLKELIPWPDRDALRKTMPDCFQVSFGCKLS